MNTFPHHWAVPEHDGTYQDLKRLNELPNASKSEYEHYGPYAYLEVMTSPEAGFDDHAIRGSLTDLARLAKLIEIKIAAADPGSSVLIREELAVVGQS